jgi:hypothetical protein
VSNWAVVVAAAVGLAGTVVGFAGALVIERQRTVRDRDSARSQREESRRDLRDRVQRETLLALQDAMVALDQCMYRGLPPPYDRAPEAERAMALAELRGPALARVRVLQVRVIDNKTRELVDTWLAAVANTVSMRVDPNKVWERMLEASDAFEAANDQLGRLLREVF